MRGGRYGAGAVHEVGSRGPVRPPVGNLRFTAWRSAEECRLDVRLV